jgi:hypothetical protein
MLDAASKVPAGSVDQYVLLKIAQDVAAGAGDAPIALRAVESLVARFDVPGPKLTAETLLTAARNATLSGQHKAIVETVFSTVEAVADADEYELALRLCESARVSAQKAKLFPAAKDFTARIEDLKTRQRAAQEYRDALAVLDRDPVEPAANLAAGRYLCFVKGDWGQGVPMLALGSDAALRTAATKDLRGADSAEEQSAIGDAWWDLAETKQGQERDMLRLRAVVWYRQAEPSLPAGLNRLKITQRLETMSRHNGPIAIGRIFLSELEPHNVILYPTMTIRDRHSVDNVWPAHGLFAHPPANSFSSITYNLPQGYRELAGTAAIADFPRDSQGQPVATASRTSLVFQVFGDGRLLWKSRPLQRSGDKQAFSVDVSGVRTLELRVDCPSFPDRAWAIWVDPALAK